MIKYNFDNIANALDMIEQGKHWYEDGNIMSNRTGKSLGTHSGKGDYLGYDVKGKTVFVHRVVFALHHGIEELKKHEVIDHINGDKYDNRIENLRGLSNSENVHLAKERLQKGNKLKFDEVREIKQLLKQGITLKVIAEKYNVTIPTVWSIKHGATFKYLE